MILQTTPPTADAVAPGALIPLPALRDNYIWLAAGSSQAVVVDPGEARPVLDFLERHPFQLAAILLTHHHADHVGGVLELVQATGARVYGPATEQLPHCDVLLRENDSIVFEDPALALRVLDVPGHTAGHIAYAGELAEQPLLFCGDTLFSAGCGRLFEGTPRQMHDSLAKFSGLPPETLVCCAHEYTLSNLAWAASVDPGNQTLKEWKNRASELRKYGIPTLPTQLALEYEINPFLRLGDPQVMQAAQQWAQRSLSNSVDIFAALREWKNAA
ncbi:hydroxyacylglutathione hydrolase [Kerstersia gyiorum]|jgi:hydroxyacylglutathione hydrolase|uniref:hydroxyacylglutathione hydrolase n=1 Tax=Kerstersia gyiorum TaxID=206506 RepID=UPI0024302C1B|nr:hydroxyacylglutathione hydrolase [Kerstersia gyiorum]MCH4270607.1 hydroxyacylglutathione hydrolase [Kerstersia gyiorum]MCI1228124.1 hydroxyacylglutathione hydrolase [Kerstersia gyiorum]